MQHQTPQFIEVEDKIFGPFTFRQFLYLAGGASISFIIYVSMPINFIAMILIMPVLGFSVALAFYKKNNKPFIQIVEAALAYFMGNKLFVWKKEQKKLTQKQKEVTSEKIVPNVPKISESKLKDISWSLDVHSKIN